MRINAVLIGDYFRVNDGWSGAGVGHFPQARSQEFSKIAAFV
jgi:hypothetical protein